MLPYLTLMEPQILDNGYETYEYMKYMSKDHFEEVMTGEVTQQLKCTK